MSQVSPLSSETPFLLTPRGVTIAGAIGNVALSVAKIAIGWGTHCRALIADGFHSLSDLVSDLAVLWSQHKSGQPPDRDHHFGHRRYQTLISLFIAVALILVAVGIAAESIFAWGVEHRAITSWAPFWAAIASIVVKEVMFQVTWFVGRRHRDVAVVANAWHHRSDAFTSVAAAAGIAGAVVGGPAWGFLDHLTAVLLAVFLIGAGWRICGEALNEFLDRAPSPEIVQALSEIIGKVPGVRSYHAIRVRQTGGMIEMDVHIQVDGQMTVQQGHEIAAHVKQSLRNADLGVSSAIVHVEPKGQ